MSAKLDSTHIFTPIHRALEFNLPVRSPGEFTATRTIAGRSTLSVEYVAGLQSPGPPCHRDIRRSRRARRRGADADRTAFPTASICSSPCLARMFRVAGESARSLCGNSREGGIADAASATLESIHHRKQRFRPGLRFRGACSFCRSRSTAVAVIFEIRLPPHQSVGQFLISASSLASGSRGRRSPAIAAAQSSRRGHNRGRRHPPKVSLPRPLQSSSLFFSSR